MKASEALTLWTSICLLKQACVRPMRGPFFMQTAVQDGVLRDTQQYPPPLCSSRRSSASVAHLLVGNANAALPPTTCARAESRGGIRTLPLHAGSWLFKNGGHCERSLFGRRWAHPHNIIKPYLPPFVICLLAACSAFICELAWIIVDDSSWDYKNIL